MPITKNYYQVLCISIDATLNQIKKAHRKLAMKYHPDINPNNSEAASKFIEIQQAYETLSNPAKRLEYDYKVGIKIKEQAKPNETYSQNYEYKPEFNWEVFFGVVASVILIITAFSLASNNSNQKNKS